MVKPFRLGVDVGGTFTDFTLMDEETGRLEVIKTPSTPSSPQQAVINGIQSLVDELGIDARDIGYFVHGTTIAVNTLIERSGAKTGLLVTRGFRDLLTLGRSRLADTYNFLVEKPEPLVPRSWVREIDERRLSNGRVYLELDEEQVRREAAWLVEQGVESIAICFLHSYRNPEHELRARQIIEHHFPQVYVSTSAETWPQMREYERALVTLINAHVGPRMDAYFRTLLSEVEATGVASNVFSTKSNGGIMTARSARRVPVQTLSSGPASGVIGAQYVGRLAGVDKVIALDMGGTSTEVAVIDGEILYSTDNTVGDFQVVMPAVDVNSIGAGGGSIAWTDSAGVLKVGPRSAGAAPGPACYGLGGTQPTITDAYLVLGIVDPDRFLGGRMRLRPELAAAAIDKIAGDLGVDRLRAAESILLVATSNMYSALVPLMAQKGVDISDFALLTYGGAGPTHGFLLAREVGINKVVVPPQPGTLCALGCLVADVKNDFIRTINVEIERENRDEVFRKIAQEYHELERQGQRWLDAERIPVQERYVVLSADMRYSGQAFDIEVVLGAVDLDEPDFGDRLLRAFHDRYAALYGVSDLTAPIEVVNLRATVIGVTNKPTIARQADAPLSGASAIPEPVVVREVYIDGQRRATRIYNRADLRWGHRFEGPAVVQQYDTTVFVPPGFEVSVDAYGNLIGEVQR